MTATAWRTSHVSTGAFGLSAAGSQGGEGTWRPRAPCRSRRARTGSPAGSPSRKSLACIGRRHRRTPRARGPRTSKSNSLASALRNHHHFCLGRTRIAHRRMRRLRRLHCNFQGTQKGRRASRMRSPQSRDRIGSALCCRCRDPSMAATLPMGSLQGRGRRQRGTRWVWPAVRGHSQSR